MDMLLQIFLSFITIFIIMDPFASIPPFLAGTRKCKDKEVADLANKAIIIAGAVALVFMFFGNMLLEALGITLLDFKVAGGIVLVLLGLENVMSFTISNVKDKKEGLESVAVLIGTPLLTGPGLITTLIVLMDINGVITTIISLLLALIASWIVLRNAVHIRNMLGDRAISIISKIIGLLLIALGISFIKSGLNIAVK